MPASIKDISIMMITMSVNTKMVVITDMNGTKSGMSVIMMNTNGIMGKKTITNAMNGMAITTMKGDISVMNMTLFFSIVHPGDFF
jgi:energy-coupling factor transporter ATP-binding protein EcfA2